MRVLIAEARPSTRAALRALLEHDVHCSRIAEAGDAQGVLAGLRDQPDVLLLDWSLPGLPAAAIVARARTLRPELIIIALGHHAVTRQAALDLGVDDFIDTNAPPEHFVAVLHELCAEEGVRG